jgi:hypothetical protein
MKFLFQIAVLLAVLAGAALSVRAQMAVPPPMPDYQPLSYEQLDQLLGPIALYPDPLIAQILPAATLPTQVVLADRYVSGGGDPGQIDQQPWDASVQALARYPAVLKWMDDNLNWTTEVGQAFLNQQQDVMDSIQRLRQSAANLGNLQSTPQQQIINDGGEIEIVPADPQVIYVPVYQPSVIYYQSAYGSPFITFGLGFAVGTWLDCDFDWRNHNLILWGREHPRPLNWWRQPPAQRNWGHTTVWRPDHLPGAVAVHRGDRGWGVPVSRPQPVVGRVGRSVSDPAAPRQIPAPPARPSAPVIRPSPVPMGRSPIISHPPQSNGAFIGIQNSQDTRNFSNRGNQSLQTTHPTPPPMSRPPVSRPSAPTGGGGHNSNQPRH